MVISSLGCGVLCPFGNISKPGCLLFALFREQALAND
jgi:hypothetical protein